MTDLREHLRTALADEPPTTIDPYAAIAAGQHRRAVRHRWLGGATAVAVVGAVGLSALALRPSAPTPSVAPISSPTPVSLDPMSIDCLSPAEQEPASYRADWGPIQSAYVCQPESKGKPGTERENYWLLERFDEVARLQTILQSPDQSEPVAVPCTDLEIRLPRIWVVTQAEAREVRIPRDHCGQFGLAMKEIGGLPTTELAGQMEQTAVEPIEVKWNRVAPTESGAGVLDLDRTLSRLGADASKKIQQMLGLPPVDKLKPFDVPRDTGAVQLIYRASGGVVVQVLVQGALRHATEELGKCAGTPPDPLTDWPSGLTGKWNPAPEPGCYETPPRVTVTDAGDGRVARSVATYGDRLGHVSVMIISDASNPAPVSLVAAEDVLGFIFDKGVGQRS